MPKLPHFSPCTGSGPGQFCALTLLSWVSTSVLLQPPKVERQGRGGGVRGEGRLSLVLWHDISPIPTSYLPATFVP